MRRVVLILVLLLAGAVVNVAVAWGICYWSRANLGSAERRSLQQRSPQSTDADLAKNWYWLDELGWTPPPNLELWESELFILVNGQVGIQRLWFEECRTRSSVVVPWSVPPRDPPPWLFGYVVRTGWPLKTLEGGVTEPRPTITQPASYVLDGGLPYMRSYTQVGSRLVRTDRWSQAGRLLPLRPIWPGFLANSIFYAAILWLLVCGSFALRRIIRRRRGICPWCTYPMGESPVCSECGKPLPGRTEAVT